MKRAQVSEQGSLSPPTTRRKIESTTTSKAVATFFKPVSKKEPEQIVWRIVNQTLVVGKYTAPNNPTRLCEKPVKVAAFDLDDTIISPIQAGNRWSRSATSWKWWDSCVPGRLKELYMQGYLVVLLSNQGNISLKDNAKSLQKDTLSLVNFKNQATSILRQLDFSVSIYAATGQDRYRKPRVGMWEELKEDFDLDGAGDIDMLNSFYIGDAAGREKTDKRRKDHAASDRDLATNIGVRFQTPEEFFLGAVGEPYNRHFDPKEYLTQKPSTTVIDKSQIFKKRNSQDLVIFCGSPGAGKSSFFWNILQPLGYERVNQDILKTRDRCIATARSFLTDGSSVAVDNTNADVETRARWIKVAHEFHVPIRCVHFTAATRLCEHNDAVRAYNQQMNPENRTLLPGIAFRSFLQRYKEPTLEEGFQDITKVDFDFVGTDADREAWSKFWVSKFST